MKNLFSQKYVNQTLQRYKLDLLFDILNLFSNCYIIPQTRKDKKWKTEVGQTSERTEGLTDSEESYNSTSETSRGLIRKDVIFNTPRFISYFLF